MLYDATVMINAYCPEDAMGHYLSDYCGLSAKELMTLIDLTLNYGIDGYAISVSKSKEQ